MNDDPSRTAAPPRLAVDGVHVRFGALTALDHVSFCVASGEILGLVGPNGSGKTTLINVVSGLYPTGGGTVRLDGRAIERLPPYRRARAGINRTFQVPRPFRSLSVRQNLEVALAGHPIDETHVDACLEQVGLTGLQDQTAAGLNVGAQKRLDLARALAARARVLLVDEIGAGLNPSELAHMAQTLTDIARTGVALVVVEHLLGFLHQLTRRVIVMNAGRAIFEGSLEAAEREPEVVDVFLGG
ncbi:MAG: ABC transporter ATP-binding protein [Acidiferrobacteraceae bacterium]